MSFTNVEASKVPFLVVYDTNKKTIKRIATPGEFQVGMRNIRSALELFGKLSIAPTLVTSDNKNNGEVYPLQTDAIIAVTTSSMPPSGRIKIYLPPNPSEGEIHFIVDVFGESDNVPIDIVPQNNARLNGEISGTLNSPYSSVGIFWQTSAWHTFATAGDVNTSRREILDVSLISGSVPTRDLTTVVLCDASSGSFYQTLPDCSVATPTMYFKKIDSSGLYVTLVGSNSQQIDGNPTLSFNVQYTTVQLVGYKGNWYII